MWIFCCTDSCNTYPRDTTSGKKKPEAAMDVFYKKCVLKNFVKFTEKHLCPSLFFNKVI